MAYLNLDLNYFDHPKTRRLVGILGPMSDVLPPRLWAYCGKLHPKDGAMKGYSGLEVEGVIGWTGEAGRAIEALMRVGFVKETTNGFACVDWRQHEGHIGALSRRASDAAKKRWTRYANGNAEPHAVALLKHTTSNTPSVPSVPTVPTNPSLPTVPTTQTVGKIFKRCVWKDGELKCSQEADIGAHMCLAHINKGRELKADKAAKRGPGW